MKTKKFKFEQRVTSIVEMNYLYKVDAKSYEEAEAKIKEAFDKKLKKGTESSPMKKYLSKYKVMDTMLAASELLEKSTLNIKYKPEKKSKLPEKLLFDNHESPEFFIHPGKDEKDQEVDIEA